ncbi:MAG: Crp/Fnr family transcriptional regulator [Lachnospiraceae bacterium]|jgi:CRP-like cAMP-binding protein|nr:Crp/Fnr family transcriptional regulator [Lachnospiraceae bacterium]
MIDISENPLFAKIPSEEIPALLKCLGAETREYKKGKTLFRVDTEITKLGIVLQGTVHTESTNILGDRSIISIMRPGQLVCDAYSSTSGRILLVDVVAQTDCTVLLIETQRLFRPCGNLNGYGTQLSENLIHVLAQKYVDLGCKVIHLSGRSTRRKLLSYLSEQFRFSGGKPFSIPFNQQELADYLFVERSGLSTEFNRLRKEGILQACGSRYTLLHPEEN